MRLIDADALLENLKKTDRYFMLKFDIEEAPTIELRPHGEWVESKEKKGHFYCSECVQKDPETGEWRETFDFKYPFCPNCGADMRKEGEAE